MTSKERYSTDYIELSISENNDNDEPPDSSNRKEEQDCQPTTALLTDQDNSSEEDFIIYESERNKAAAPKHENSLAIQVKSSTHLPTFFLYKESPYNSNIGESFFQFHLKNRMELSMAVGWIYHLFHLCQSFKLCHKVKTNQKMVFVF